MLLTSHLFGTCRTNSDSALHQSAMNPKPQEMFAGGSQELQPKRGNGICGWKAAPVYLGDVQIQAADQNECQLPRSGFGAFPKLEINTNNANVWFLRKLLSSSADSEQEDVEGSVIHLLCMDYIFSCEALIRWNRDWPTSAPPVCLPVC